MPGLEGELERCTRKRPVLTIAFGIAYQHYTCLAGAVRILSGARSSMMRHDAHQHFWKYDPVDYGWINDEMATLKRDFLPRDLAPLLAASGFDGCIAVQARQSLEETRWLLELAERNDFIKGV